MDEAVSRPWIPWIVLAWVAGFGLDAGVALVDEVVHLAVGGHPLMLIRQLFALVMFPLTAAVIVATGLSPQAPLRVVLPPLAWNLWALLGAMPVLLWLFVSGTYGLAIVALQLVAGVVSLVGVSTLGRRPEVVLARLVERPSFRMSRVIGTAVVIPLIAVGSAVWVVGNVQYAVSWSTSGYVSVDATGLHMARRTLERGADQVHLVGMVHLAEAGSFEALFEGFADLDRPVVLEEGVTDRDGLLRAAGRGYEKVAETLGLEEQPRVGDVDGVEVRHADIDVGELSPDALALIRAILGFYGSDQPAFAIVALQEELEALGGDEQVLVLLMDQLVRLRNDRLEGHVDRVLTEGRPAVVPWGALHLPDLEARLRADGFTVTAESRRLVVRHATWLAALGRLFGGGPG